MYKFESKIRYSEVDETGLLAVPKIVDYFQDCSNFQSDQLGVGRAFLEERKLGWVLSFWQIVFDRRPAQNEVVKVGTFPYDFKGILGMRNFFLEDAEGTCIVSANSVWTLLNMETGWPVKAGEEIVCKYTLEEKLPMEYVSRKLNMPKEGESFEAVTIGRERLDTNRHVNNAQYISMAMNYVPCEMDIAEIRVEYKKQAYVGTIIYPLVSVIDGGIAISLRDEAGQPYVNMHVLRRAE